jgi:pimeloyl-ACP methyl ester carboxylesterase
MGTFVLIHGGWHGGWCYKKVARLLRCRGHDVYAPSLTGLGDRAHLAKHLHINLTTHIDDVIAVLETEELTDVVLCGHSYGGMVITGVASRDPSRIRSLFYLDALVPVDGQSACDAAPVMAESVLRSTGDGHGVPPFPAAAFNCNPGDVALVDRRCVSHPVDTLVERLRLTGQEKKVRNRAFVLATGWGSPAQGESLAAPFELIKHDPAWAAYTVPCGHEVMLDAPEELARLLEIELTR